MSHFSKTSATPSSWRITLEGIYDALRDMKHEVEIDADTARRARQSLRTMLDVPAGDGAPAFDITCPQKSAEIIKT